MTLLLADHGHTIVEAAPWMWVVWAGAFALSVWAIWAAVRATFRPGEDEPDHVKRVVLEDDVPPSAAPGGTRA